MDDLLARSEPVAEEFASWANGTVQLRRTAYVGTDDLPDELVTSVRCLVNVEARFVVCTNVEGASHPWPGGQRQPGESFVETACREVHEETGWRLDPNSLRRLGWLHLEHLTPVPDDHPWPHPDCLQVVYIGSAHERDGVGDWTDTEGYEATSRLLARSDAYDAVEGDAISRVFLDLLL